MTCTPTVYPQPYPIHHTRWPLSFPGLSEVRKKEKPPPPLVTNPEQRSILFTWLLKDCLQRPGTTARSGGTYRLILGLEEFLWSKFEEKM